MKNKFSLLMGTTLCVALLSGCHFLDQNVLKKPTPTVQQVPQVQSTTVTNQDGIPVTTYTTNTITVTNQVYSPDVNPQLNAGIDTVKQYTGMLPPPYSDAANLLLLIAGGAAAFYAKQRSGQLNKTSSMLGSVITGIEAVPETSTLKVIKDSIASHSTAAGVSAELDAVVQNISGKMP